MDVKETKELLGAVEGLTSELHQKSEDGVLNIADFAGLIGNVSEVIREAKDIDTIKAELKDLDAEELKEISGELIDIVFDVVGVIGNKPKFQL